VLVGFLQGIDQLLVLLLQLLYLARLVSKFDSGGFPLLLFLFEVGELILALGDQ
jgi:hypothetical protein